MEMEARFDLQLAECIACAAALAECESADESAPRPGEIVDGPADAVL